MGNWATVLCVPVEWCCEAVWLCCVSPGAVMSLGECVAFTGLLVNGKLSCGCVPGDSWVSLFDWR